MKKANILRVSRKRAFQFLIVVMLFYFSMNGASAITPGATCKKVGQVQTYKGKKFTCIKMGKKLFWDNGIKLTSKSNSSTPSPKPSPSLVPTPVPSTSSAPTPTSKPTPTPTPTLTPKGVIAAFQSFGEFPKSQLAPQKLNFHFGPNADKEFSDLIVAISNETMKIMADHFPDSRPYPYFYGSVEDIDWIIAEWAKYGYRDQGEIDDVRRRGPNGLVVTYWNSPQAATTMIYSQANTKNLKNIGTYNYAESDRVQTQLIAHHVVHGIQQRAAGDGRYGLLHCWVREGGSDFYGAMIVHRAKKGDYLRWRNVHMGDWVGNSLKIDPRKLTDMEWFDLLNSLDCNGGNYFPYVYGALLTERLVGEFGHQKVMDWWQGMRLTRDWKEAFQSAFGIEVQNWYRTSGIPYLVAAYKEWIPDARWPGFNR
jgi:hypothetical protein